MLRMPKMVRWRSLFRGGWMVVAVWLGTGLVGAASARAAEVDVVAREVVVRSAPFEVAPEIARVHAGDKLSGNDQASGAWRFVKLPDGRGGYLHEADVRIVAPPAPAGAPGGVGASGGTGAPGGIGAPAGTGAPGGIGAPGGTGAPGGPGAPASPAAPQSAHVTALELGVRATPAADAAVTMMLHRGDPVVALPELKDGWRSVQLSDGQTGFVQEAGLTIDGATPTAPPVVMAAAPQSMAPAPPATEPTPPDVQLGLLFELLPTGTISASEIGYATATSDTAVAFAVAPSIDFPLASPYVALGFSPQFVFGVKGTSAASSATEYDLRARLTGRYPVSDGGAIYARVSPGYSIISVPGLAPGVSNPAGFLLDLAAGAEIVVNPKVSVTLELGYQIGFQSTSDPSGAEVSLETRYLHLGVGFLLPL